MSNRIQFGKEESNEPSMNVIHGADDGKSDTCFYDLFLNILRNIAPGSRGNQARAVISALALMSLKDHEEYSKACTMMAVLASTLLSDKEFDVNEAPTQLAELREKMMEMKLDAKKTQAEQQLKKP